MVRKDVYRLIDGERDYQNTRWGSEHDDHSVAEWLIFMEAHIEKAKHALYHENERAAMEQIRKVTALGVVAMENNHTPMREDADGEDA